MLRSEPAIADEPSSQRPARTGAGRSQKSRHGERGDGEIAEVDLRGEFRDGLGTMPLSPGSMRA